MGRRALAWGLILYGLAGLLLLGTVAVIGLDTAGRLERLVADADGTLAAASRATDAAAEAFTEADVSLSEAERSAAAAAGLSREAAGTLRSLALAMELSVFGAQPLLPLSGEFTTSAEQAEQLADTLTSVGSSLGETRTDIVRVGAELDGLGDRLEALRGSTGAAGATPPLRFLVGLLLVWLAVPAAAALVVGLAMLRRRPATVTVVQRGEPAAPPADRP